MHIFAYIGARTLVHKIGSRSFMLVSAWVSAGAHPVRKCLESDQCPSEGGVQGQGEGEGVFRAQLSATWSSDGIGIVLFSRKG